MVTTQHFLTPARVGRSGVRAVVDRMMHRWVGRQTNRTIAISRAVERGILRRREMPADKVCVVHNGISDPRAQPLAMREEVRRQFSIPENAPLIVCVARLEVEKDLFTLVQSMPHVLKVFPSAHCLVVGSGSEQEHLQSGIVSLGIQKSVQLLGFQSEPLPIVNAADVFVLPSLAEPFGLSIVEAMALGKPVISTRAGGPVEIVQDGITGRLVAPGDGKELAGALIELLGSPECLLRFGIQARARFESCFTAERMALEVSAVYQLAIDEVSLSKAASDFSTGAQANSHKARHIAR